MSFVFPGDFNEDNEVVYTSFARKVSEYIKLSFKETAAAHVFKADLSGARKEEVNIQGCDRTLVICPTSKKSRACLHHECSSPIAVPIEVEDGKRRGEEEGETDTWHNLAITHHCCHGSEYSNDKFRLEYTLPKNAKVEQAKASMENGLLSVTIPKEKVQFPSICDVTEGDIDDLKEAINLMIKMSAINHTWWTRVSQQPRQIEHLYEQVQFPSICDVTEGDIDDLKEAIKLMIKMSAINHTWWTRVSQQARQIEHLYEQVQFPFICDVTEGDIDDLKEAFNLMDKMSAINHTLWTRVSQQARQIEHLYEQAVEAKKTIELGNMELAQAIKRNSCGSTFLLILLVLLALCLLF